jgi:flagellar biosynthesis protein FlhB
MAEDRTEEASPKKLRQARERGEVPKSRELGTAAVILATAGALAASGPYALGRLRETFALVFRAAEGDLGASPGAVLEAGAALGISAVVPVLVFALAAGTLASFLQVGPLLTLQPIAPSLGRLDPLKGFGNLFSQRQAIELIKSLLKIAIIGYVAYTVFRDGLRGVIGLAARDADAALGATGAMVTTMMLRVGGAMAAIAILDVLYQRWRHAKDQRMTKEEVKREHKESEGDPHAKQQRERMHREIVAHAAVEEVRRADVLVVNPTHLAIALRYDEEAEQEAPEVIAKGQDDLAQRMIEAAREAGVPILRDVPLARALFDLEVGDEIPEALYEAVAIVLRAAWAERAPEEKAP